LKIDPNAELFVFVGRWSVQKGVDLIADVFPAVLEKHPNTQLICIGPVIDLYGKFAALKLEAIMKKYPGRVFSKPEFTQLPPYIFSGAEFALIPSRDEPFGLVAVEFGRKGALGVGARVGGLGQMPGWWFTVESTSSKHLIHQFKAAIDDALGSSQKLRSGMRAQSAKQRFPVARWVEDLEILHSASIRIHEREKRSGKGLRRRTRPSSVDGGLVSSYIYEDQEQAHTEEPIGQAGGISRSLSLGHRAGPGHKVAISPGDRLADVGEIAEEDSEFHMTVEEVETAIREDHVRDAARSLEGQGQGLQAQFIFEDDDMETRDTAYDPQVARMEPPSSEREHTRLMAENTGSAFYSPSLSRSPSPARGRPSLLPGDALRNPRTRSTASLLSLNDVTSGRRDYSLQQVDSEFRDSTGEYYQKFQTLLQQLDAKSSEHGLVIEEYLKEAEKEWASRYRAAKLGRSTPVHSRPASRDASPAGSLLSNEGSTYVASLADEFMLGHSYVRPTVLKRCLQTRIFDWPVYTIFLALGQILAANSYQLVLLTGGSTQGEATKIYVVGSIYVVASCLWWAMFRTMSARWVTSIPFAFYGLAFIIIGLAPLVPVGNGRQWTRNVATGLYSTASASGSLYFALNFGDEGEFPDAIQTDRS
jgi:alpha-1,3-glucan synthase